MWYFNTICSIWWCLKPSKLIFPFHHYLSNDFPKIFERKMILTPVHYCRFFLCRSILYGMFYHIAIAKNLITIYYPFEKFYIMIYTTFSYTYSGYVNVRFEMKQNPWYDFHWSQSRFDYLHLQLWIMYKGFKPEYTKHCFYFPIRKQQKVVI